jgi:hypothetical protein
MTQDNGFDVSPSWQELKALCEEAEVALDALVNQPFKPGTHPGDAQRGAARAVLARIRALAEDDRYHAGTFAAADHSPGQFRGHRYAEALVAAYTPMELAAGVAALQVERDRVQALEAEKEALTKDNSALRWEVANWRGA